MLAWAVKASRKMVDQRAAQESEGVRHDHDPASLFKKLNDAPERISPREKPPTGTPPLGGISEMEMGGSELRFSLITKLISLKSI